MDAAARKSYDELRLEASPETSSAAPKAPPKRGLGRLIPLALLAAVLGVAGVYWYRHRFLETTDDAQVDADVVPVTTRAGGTVVGVHFVDNQVVKKDDLLLELDAAPAKARLAQAEAELLVAKATADAADATATLTEKNANGGKKIAEASLQGASVSVVVTADSIGEAKAQAAAAKTALEKAKTDLDRAKSLVASGALPGSALESAQATYDTAQSAMNQAIARVTTMQASTTQAQSKVTEASARLALADTVEAQIKESNAKAAAARARVATAQAARDLADLELSYTRILAPRDGVISRRSVAEGQTISIGTTVLMIVPTEAVWVTANFKETQLVHMKVGQPVKISIDAYGGREIDGSIESFSGATGARFALLPPDNATGNFTKVVQRLPVRIKIKDLPKDLPLRPGLSVELSVDTRN